MKMTFRPLTVEEYGLAEQFKRATAVDAVGDAGRFEVWFPPERPYRAMLERLQAFDPEGCLLALMGDEIVGHLDMRVSMTEGGAVGHLNNVYLRPEWRGRGLGAQMDARAMAFFAKHGATWVTLKTNPLRPKLVAFYERMGWRFVDHAELGMIVMGRDI